MEYFAKTINMNLLRNHISRDPIIDWFEIQNLRNTIFSKDKNNYFRKYILNENSYSVIFFLLFFSFRSVSHFSSALYLT